MGCLKFSGLLNAWPLAIGAFLGGAGYGWAFVANSASFTVFTVILLVGKHGTAKPERRSRITAGFQIAKCDGMIMILLLMVAAITVADDPVLVLGPALTARMHVSMGFSGWRPPHWPS